jgi:ATP-dependent DNA helicase RecG
MRGSMGVAACHGAAQLNTQLPTITELCMYTELELITILKKLLRLPAETEWVEFKKAQTNFSDFDLGTYFSALANEANLKQQRCAWLVLGVEDAYPHKISGTGWLKGNRAALDELKQKIAEGTGGHTFSEIYELTLTEGRVLMFCISPSPVGMPTPWKGHYYGRNGESKVPLSISKLEAIRNQNIQSDWSAEICPSATIDDLDPTALAVAKEKFLQKHKGRQFVEDTTRWDLTTFLDKAKLTRNGKLTRAAILLLGKPESAHHVSPHPAQITWKLVTEEEAYEHFGPPFLIAIEMVFSRIRNVKFRIQASTRLLPEEIDKYDSTIVLEALNNCIAHQDYTKNSRIIVTETTDRLILQSSGEFYDGSVEDYVLHEKTPDRYRNTFLAQAMVCLNMIDTMGMGIRRIFQKQSKRYLPMPEYDLSNNAKVVVTIFGRQLDENYGKILMERKDLSLAEIVALDRIQKAQPVEREIATALRRKGLITGRYPKLYLAADIARATGSPADYTKHRAFDKSYYKDLVLKFLWQHKEGTPHDFQRLLLDKLSDLDTESQRKAKLRNLLQEMAKEGQIRNIGARGNQARWRLTDYKPGQTKR